MQTEMMTLKEFKADYSRETGAKMSAAGWSALYSQYQEHEAEAIAGGKYEVDPAVEEVRLARIAAAKPFRVMIEMPRYCIHTDGLIGSERWIAGGYDTREEAEAARATMYTPEEASSWVEPREILVRPAVADFDPEECPF